MPTSKILRAALGWTFYQILIVLFVTNGKLKSLVHWDAIWYRDIAVNGYDGAYPLKSLPTGGSNIAFFPAFPLSVRGVLAIFPVDPDLAVSFAAQIACIGVWAYFLLLLRRFKTEPMIAFAAALLFFVQPGAFYHVVGYSEALFTGSLLGFLYWSTRWAEDGSRKPLHFLLAAAHGAVLSSTRILGVALAAYPLILIATRALSQRSLKPRPALGAAALGLLSLGGFGAFLGYCQIRWGHWDIYWEANRIGWRVYFDPWKMLHWEFYRDVFFFGTLSEVLGRVMTVITLGGVIGLTRWSWKRVARDPLPLAICLLNLGLMAETIVGSHGMHSMTRYLLPIHALAIPVLAAWAQEKHEARRLSFRAATTTLLIGLFLFAIQVLYTIRYSHSDWVS